MYFVKGSELDKQIYKEGEPTWGCKSGVLDVEDVKTFIVKLKEQIRLTKNRDDKVHARLMILDGGGIGKSELVKLIDELVGEKLIKNYSFVESNETKGEKP